MTIKKTIIFCLMVIALSSCSTQRYGRQSGVLEAERKNLSCKEIEIEIAKSKDFIKDIKEQREQTTGAHVLGALGDFGIGNVMEGDAAEASGKARLKDLESLYASKNCASLEKNENV